MAEYKNPYANSGGYKNPYADSGSSSQANFQRIQSLEDFENAAQALGFKKEKPSMIKRIFSGMGEGVMKVLDFTQRANYAVAGAAKEIVEGGDNILGETWKGLSGQERDTFSDVLESAGVENKIVRGVAGFALDVALDPLTYAGGAGLLKKVGKHTLTKSGLDVLQEYNTAKNLVKKSFSEMAENAAKKAGTKGVDKSIKTSMRKEFNKTMTKMDNDLYKKLYQKPDEFFKGITIFGQNVVPYKTAKGLYKGTFGKAAEAVKTVGKFAPKPVQKSFSKFADGVDTLKDGLGKAFNIYHGRISKADRNFLDETFKIKNYNAKAREPYIKLLKETFDKTPLTDDQRMRLTDALLDNKEKVYLGKVYGGANSIIKKIKSINPDIPDGLVNDIRKLADSPKSVDRMIGSLEKYNKAKVKYLQGNIDKFKDKAYIEKLDPVKDLIAKLNSGKEYTGKQIDMMGRQAAESIKLASLKEGNSELRKEVFGKAFKEGDELIEIADINDGQRAAGRLIATLERQVDEVAKKAKLKKLEKSDFKLSKFITREGNKPDAAKLTSYFRKELTELMNREAKSEDLIYKLANIRREARKFANSKDLDWEFIGTKSTGKKGAKLSDEALKAKEFFDTKMSKTINKISELGGYTDEPLKYYFPSIDKNKTKEYLLGTASKRIKEKPEKLYRGLIANEDLIKDPLSAYTLKTQKLLSDNIARETKQYLVDVYGKSPKAFNSLSDIQKVGLKPIDVDGKLIGYLKEIDKKLIDGTLAPEMNIVDELARAFQYDNFTNVFKKLVTAYFPAFHIRNAASGVIQNYQVLGGKVFNPDRLRESLGLINAKNPKVANKIFKSKGFTGTYEELLDVLTDNFKRSSQFIAEYSGAIDNPLEFRKVGWGQKAGDFVETHQKAHAMVTALKDNKTLNEAIEIAEKAGFDYNKVTKFESSVMKRIIPFYSFARKNAELQLKTAVENPSRILNQIKFPRMLSEVFGGKKPTEEDLKGIPPWARDALGFKINDGQIISNFDVPVKEFISRVTDPMGTTLTSLNPLIKYPVEAFTGFDFFRGEQVVEINKIDGNIAKLIESEHTPQVIKDLFDITYYDTEQNGKKKRVYKADPYALHALRSLPYARMQQTMEKIWSDDEEIANKVLSFLIGAKIYDIDQETQKYFDNRDFFGEYSEFVERYGIGYTSDDVYLNIKRARELGDKQDDEL